MDPATLSLQTITRLKWKLVDVFETNVNDLVKETRSFIKREILDTLDNIHNPAEKVVRLLDLIIHEGESACETFLGRLLSLAPGIPNLNSLSAEFPERKRENFRDLLAQLDMTQYTESKLTLKSVLNISKNNLKKIECQNLQDAPWYFLRKLIALNQTARNMRHEEMNIECISDNIDDDLLTYYDNDSIIKNASSSLHPLDVMCALLHCSDHFLQQEIVSKMSMCQFAVPLLLPAGDGTYCTLMLWAMRDIVKRWRPHSLADSKGFMEDNVVNVPMPTFSFVRLGKTKLSKSKILNQVLSQDQQHLDFFIHDNMQGGNIERKISNGLVEMSWYFPSGSDSSDIFSEPIAVTNLRGDLESNWNQFSFLTRVSSAVFIFTESIGEREIRVLSKCDNSSTKYYFIISPNPGSDVRETIRRLNKIKSVLKLEGNNIILRRPNDNDTDLVRKIQSSIKSRENYSKIISVQTMDTLRLGICVDEGSEDFRRARQHAERITEAIRDVIVYKKETLALQGDLWKQLSKTEKEMCRMKNQGAKSGSEYENELKEKWVSLYAKRCNHYRHGPPIGIMSFIAAIITFSDIEKHYFLKWMKLNLDSIIQKNLSELRKEYQEKSKKEIKNKEELKHLEQKIYDSSLGIEHFLRETGQVYEAECAMSKEQKISIMKPYNQLPGIAADLLLDGFPLELIDGEVSNIPMQWITDILTELDTKTGGRCRMRVISVLGVHSTGKSTLLNTMFGLQFPVASGRCNRGAFMTLVRVEENFIAELGCDLILVIDTEGLKAPELASLVDSYEHDNELATLVIGLSDITIINMAMENTAEIKDILQIVIHAFLRMKAIGKKPKCLFVHQNVSDVSANQNNKRDTKKLLELLDEMTKVAANMENISESTTFNSIIDYDPDNNNWYVPGLWHGVPPMASVNHGYSETVYELKMSLCEYLKTCKSLNKPHSIKDFITWIDSLWNAVKHEKFIFSFRNSLEAEAYKKLSIRFSQWEWDFTKAVYSRVSDTDAD
uniref:VLIG-type G domain-containing protein n=1 Tax=Leptobrachium leishanense TaxID=445787 RepID=A0A8C5QBM8_9ANUR